MLTLYIVTSALALAAHELGHVGCALALDVRVKRAGLSWRGPYIVRESGSDVQNLAIALAGPLVNLLLAALLPIYARVVGVGGVMFAFSNVTLAIFNLLPLPLSDGRRVVELLMTKPKKGVQAA